MAPLMTAHTHGPEFRPESPWRRQWPQDDPGDRRRSRHPPDPGESVEEALLDGASELFTRGKKSKDQEGGRQEAELFQQIGKLQMDWSGEKISAALTPMNCGSWSIQTTPSSVSAANVRCWACPDRRITTGRHQCGIDLRIMARIDALYLEDPCSGSRRMVEYLDREGIPVSRDRVRAPCAARGYGRSTRSTRPCQASHRAISLSGGPQAVTAATRSGRPISPTSRYRKDSSTWGDRGSVLQKRAQLEACRQP